MDSKIAAYQNAIVLIKSGNYILQNRFITLQKKDQFSKWSVRNAKSVKVLTFAIPFTSFTFIINRDNLKRY